MQQKIKTDYVPRVNQLDALQLDFDVIKIVKDQLTKALANLSPGLLSHLQPELDLLLRAAIWQYSIGCQLASFGQQLLFICYDKDQANRTKLTLHFILTVVGQYAKDTATFRLTNNQRIQGLVMWIDNLLIVCSFMNFFRFLKTGKKPSLVDYVLGLDNITMHGNKRRDVGYSHMTRELIWGGFMEFLGFTVPLINYHSVKRKLRNMVSFSQKKLGIDTDQLPELRLTTRCSYCGERPTLPHHIGCGHIFCYYCIQGNVEADTNFQCPVCDAGVTNGIKSVIQFKG